LTAPRGNNNNNSSRRRRPPDRGKGRPANLWRPVPAPPDPEPIAPSDDPGALVRSLGQPPLYGQGAAAEHYLVAVIERAAGLAAALAASAGLLAGPSDS